MLCALSTHNIGVIVCDQDHLPMGYYSSYDNYSRISKSIQYQIQCTKEAYNCIWKDIVKNKISNQKSSLEITFGTEKCSKIITVSERSGRWRCEKS